MFRERFRGEPPIDRGEPNIIHIGDVALIGVMHNAYVHNRPQAATHVLDRVNKSSYLLLEGAKGAYLDRVSLRSERINFENLAQRAFLGRDKEADIYYLEEGNDGGSLGVDYGFDMQSLAFCYAFESVNSGIELRQGASLSNEIEEVADTFNDMNPSFPIIDKAQLKRSLELVYEWSGRDDPRGPSYTGLALYHHLEDGHDLVLRAIRQVSDYEVIIPNIKSIVSDPDLIGPKVVIVGNAHFQSVETALRGGELAQPKQWPDYKRSLRRRERRLVKFHEAVANGKW